MKNHILCWKRIKFSAVILCVTLFSSPVLGGPVSWKLVKTKKPANFAMSTSHAEGFKAFLAVYCDPDFHKKFVFFDVQQKKEKDGKTISYSGLSKRHFQSDSVYWDQFTLVVNGIRKIAIYSKNRLGMPYNFNNLDSQLLHHKGKPYIIGVDYNPEQGEFEDYPTGVQFAGRYMVHLIETSKSIRFSHWTFTTKGSSPVIKRAFRGTSCQ